jgi:hypothetical protein
MIRPSCSSAFALFRWARGCGLSAVFLTAFLTVSGAAFFAAFLATFFAGRLVEDLHVL